MLTPTPRRLRTATLAALGGALVITPLLAQQRDRLPRECRAEIVRLCGTDRSQMRSCLIERRGELSDRCASELQDRVRDRLGDRAGARDGAGRAAAKRTGEEFAYGLAPLQRLDFWRGEGERAPLILFVHGGGWKRGDKAMMEGSAKLSHWREQGYAVASVNYRLVPQATVEQQAADVAAALAYLLKDADRLGIDASRVVITGHSAGAHLVALVGTDERYLRAAGLSFADIDGVLPNDGAAYHVPSQMGENAVLLGDTYEQAFGTDPERQLALSPTAHAAAPNAPAFLLIHVERPDGIRQAKGLEDALRAAGTRVERRQFAGTGLSGHRDINQKLGEADYPATAVVDAWLRNVLR